MDTKEFKGVIEDIVDARMSKKGITKYVSAIIKNVNGDGSVNVYLPPDKTKIVSNVINKTGETLNIGDSVELCTKNGKTSNAWVSVKHGTNLGNLSEQSNIFRNLFNVGNASIRTNNYPDFSSSLDFNKTNNQILINGSSSIGTNIFLDSPKANKDEEGIILKAGTYTATIKKVSGSLSGGDIEFNLRKSDGGSIYIGTKVLTQKILSGVLDNTVYSDTFTLEEETRLHWIGYFAGEVRTFNNLVLQFQIEESPTPTSYTPWAGYMVESGSNENGSWIKWADGTMICRHIVSTANVDTYYHFAIADWGYPIAFVDVPQVVATAKNWTTNMVCIKTWNDNTYARIMSLEFSLVDNTPQDLTCDVNVIAIGRWK